MSSKSIFDQLLGSLGGAAGQPGSATQPGTGTGAGGGLGDLLAQFSGALGGGGRGTGGTASGGLSDILAQIQGKMAQAGGGAAGGMGQMMGDTPSFAKGAAAGGLMGALLGGRGTAKAAGAAVIGTLAWKAYQNWMAQKQVEEASPPAQAALQQEHFVPTGAAAEQLSDKLARAMVAAAKADGKVTSLERRRIVEALTERGMGAGAKEMVEQELDSPLDVARIAAMAATEEEAVQIYTASLLAVDPEEEAEAAYLAELASRLGLPPDLVAQLHHTTEG